uniref:dTDP-4-amino-4,6-dideoxy-D-galactose acyltransferase n=1 Tax=Candidatus Aschnera chinzeii TaxID=1485666 RepID=A0AAT9G4P2_9ENTR|nr:MAG: dTDP-4-amino-4,6-dideoxy-D-galactose acyltransferase [Candidatus Aschnera chinzeii]
MSIKGELLNLTWESKFFKSKIAKLVFTSNANIIPINKFQQFDIVETSIDTNKLALLDTLINIGFKLVTTYITFSINIDKIYTDNNLFMNNTNLIFATTNDIKYLKNIAATIFTNTRFRTPWYSIKNQKKLYSTWIEKSIYGRFDNACLLIKNNKNEINGFVTIKRLSTQKTAKIGLLGTIPLFRGLKIGTQLIMTACHWCYINKVKKLYITTQINNIHAIRLYSNIKSQFENSFYWLYRG